ncbi:hypothetical protein EIL87_25310 [Saccharopolyspora rhizosphaerae]|uniref:Mucin n=1 Tax=Saccharopolyspora rhizosphaerae TaxID=2492662 RepID=A0A3R8QX78_9PSEU|nr:DUF6319 family protein [Saccharopolyspora rhizosphaerae]RRO12985.1 hypothetical protein EIL87_25310 [Saccharopolyspora rhizosphaerae]
MTEEQTTPAEATGATSTTPSDVDAAPASAETPAPAAAEAPAAAPKKRQTRKSTAKKTRTVELTLTVTGTADGEWQADLMHQGKRVVQALPVAAAAVSKAAAELNTEISETIEGVINEARQQHEAKLAELEAEVERVRKALAELEG